MLGASCYARGSQRFYDWLLNNRWLGGTIRDYREGRGILLRQKLLTMIILWMTIGTSAYFFVDKQLVQVLLIFVAVGVSLHLVFIRTRQIDSLDLPITSHPLPEEVVSSPD